MFRNYLKIAWRNLVKSKGYTVINIAGLAVGVCCFILIALFVEHEFSYDKFHTKADQIYRVWQHENYGPKEDFVNTTTPVSMVEVLSTNYPEIENGTRVHRFNSLVKKNEVEFNEAVRAVDPEFFEVFDFKIVEGNSEDPLADANAIILSETAARKYFGGENAIGKTLSLEFNNEVHIYTVSALASDPPQNSSIQFNMLVSIANEARFFNDGARTSWFNVAVESYLVLRPEVAASQLESKLPSIIKQYLGDQFEEGTFFLHLQPLTAIHLDNSLPAGLEAISNPRYSYVLATIGLLVLLLACINFVTLAVGRSFSRATEVGVRKALGAFRKQIVYQFWGEALLITLIAIVFGIGLAYLFQDTFNSLTGKTIAIAFNLSFWIIAFVLVILIGLIAGVYPSIVLSRFSPIQVLRRKKAKAASMGLLGKGLVVTQFVASIVMLVATLVIGRQIDYLVGKDLGYNKDAIVVVPTNMSGEAANEFADLYVAELEKQPLIASATRSLYSFMENGWVNVGFTDATNTYREFSLNLVDPNFLGTHDIPILNGRDFESGSLSDAENGVLVNEAFVQQFGLNDPVGKSYDKFDIQILGVVKDFNYLSLNNTIAPLLMAINPSPIFTHAENLETQYTPQPRVSVNINSSDIGASIAVLKNTWEKINPTQEFEYSFLDEALAVQYQNELRSKTIVNIASILSFFIACMGLFGLATLNVARRTAEIGIRKVLGAGVMNIVQMITIDFIKLILIALLLAFPLAWWSLDQWLQSFAYSVGISWWIFVVTGIIAIGITLLTVSFQSIRASLTNPVKSLRTE